MTSITAIGALLFLVYFFWYFAAYDFVVIMLATLGVISGELCYAEFSGWSKYLGLGVMLGSLGVLVWFMLGRAVW